MVWKLLQLDGIHWKYGRLGNDAVILEPMIQEGHLDYIHRLFSILENHQIKEVTDVVPAYKSVAIFFEGNESDMFKKIENLNFEAPTDTGSKKKTYEFEVNYEPGMDWDRVCSITGFSKNECIERHSKPIYKVAMIGFLPGFIFLEGLDPELTVPRLDTPRTHIPGGSVGIGGVQTGVYSIESPGGWNIIGRTGSSLFDVNNNPPISVKPGDQVKFKPLVE
ncbi:MAG: 5-oxoprolinase subunit PxpB [Cyanothece sp. SIO1E1]|nr:5-oxoprolinase subunit PxpB [Cyanothece sp. SIO1E1]